MTTDTLEFPQIAETPAAALPAVQQSTDLAKIDLTAVALAQYGDWRKDVAATKSNLGTLVLDLSTPAKIKEARTLRQRLIGDPLATMRKVAAGIKSKMAQTSKALGAELEAIESAYTEADALILPLIEKREAELERAREEARKIEEVRKEKHRTNIEAIRIYVERASAPGMTAERIARGITQLESLATPTREVWEEFAVLAANAICETLEKMRALHAQALANEAAAAEAERVRKEQARIAAELAEQQRQLAEQRAAIERERAELEAARALQAQQQIQAPPAGPAGDGSQKPNGDGQDCPARAGSDTPQRGLTEVCPRGEVMAPEACESATGRGETVAPALASAPSCSPCVGTMGAGQAADAAPAANFVRIDPPPPGYVEPETVLTVYPPNAPAITTFTPDHSLMSKSGPADEKPTLKLGAINDWLSPIHLDAAGLALLGINHSGTDKAAKLYKPSDKARIKAALIAHLEAR